MLKNVFKTILSYVLIFICLLFVNESGAFLLKYDKYFVTIILCFIIIFSVIINFIINNKKKLLGKQTLFFVVSILFILISMILNGDFDIENVLVILGIIIAYGMVLIYQPKDFIEKFINIIIFLCIFTLISTYIIQPLCLSGKINFFKTYISLNRPFYDMYFSYTPAYKTILRTMSIFREPGIFQIYLLITIFLYVFYLKKKSVWVLFLFIVTLISTYSTSGLICMIPILFYVLFNNQAVVNYKKIILVSVIVLSCIYFVYNNDNFKENIIMALSKINNQNDESTVVRFESIINLLKVSFFNPIIGNSVVKGLNTIHLNYSSYDNTNVTGTFFVFIMAYGYIFGVYLMIIFYKFIYKICNKEKLKSVIIFISLFLSINTQNIIYSWFLWLLFFYGIGDDIYEKKD